MEEQEDTTWAARLGKLDRYSADEVIAAWQEHTKHTRETLNEMGGGHSLSRERQYLYVLLYRDTRHSAPVIGRLIGGRVPTTILWGLKKIWPLLEAKDPATLQFIASVEAFYPAPSRKAGIQEALAKKSLEEPHTMVA